MYKIFKVELLVTEHQREASPWVTAMEPSRRGCLLPSELPKELPVEGNIDALPSDTKYKDASCRLKKRIETMVRYMNRI